FFPTPPASRRPCRGRRQPSSPGRLYDREADQGRGDEHVIVEPIGQDRGQRMTERCGTDEGDRLPGAAAAAGNRRLRQAVLDLLKEWPVRGPFRIAQPGVACTAAVIPRRSNSAQSGSE